MITKQTFSEPPFDRQEILRYARATHPSPELSAMLEDCIKEARSQLSYRVCYEEFPLTICGAQLDFGFASVQSEALAKFLSGAGSAVFFAATIGAALDRLIARTSITSPARALLLDAIGVERIEALCDAFSDKPRFSPGYGDLPLAFQREIFRALDCPRKIGVSLSESLFMSPSKSVTAILGVR